MADSRLARRDADGSIHRRITHPTRFSLPVFRQKMKEHFTVFAWTTHGDTCVQNLVRMTLVLQDILQPKFSISPLLTFSYVIKHKTAMIFPYTGGSLATYFLRNLSILKL